MKDTIKLIKPGKKQINQQLIIGIVLCFVGFAGLFVAGNIPSISGLGLLFIVMSLTSKNKDVIKVYDDYMEMKLALLAPQHFVKFSDITSVDLSKPKALFFFYKRDGKEKKIRLNKQFFNEDDFNYLTELLADKIKKVA
nr:hypothetical protein [uncultured Carboxylicivirga sp.]